MRVKERKRVCDQSITNEQIIGIIPCIQVDVLGSQTGLRTILRNVMVLRTCKLPFEFNAFLHNLSSFHQKSKFYVQLIISFCVICCNVRQINFVDL